MFRTLITLLCFAATLMAEPGPESIIVDLSEGVLRIKDDPITMPTKIGPLSWAFETTYHNVGGRGREFLWNDAGIQAVADETGAIHRITIYYDDRPEKSSASVPEQGFSGRFILNGFAFDDYVSIDDYNRRVIAPYRFVQTDEPGSYLLAASAQPQSAYTFNVTIQTDPQGHPRIVSIDYAPSASRPATTLVNTHPGSGLSIVFDRPDVPGLWKRIRSVLPDGTERTVAEGERYTGSVYFSPDGEFVIYELIVGSLKAGEAVPSSRIACGVADAVSQRTFFDEPALGHCQSDWLEGEPHTLFNAQDVDAENDYAPHYFYRLPKASFTRDYRNVESEAAAKRYDFVRERFTIETIDRYLSLVPLATGNVREYNNIAYFLERSGSYAPAVHLLETIVAAYPDRTVAYINLGDALWGEQQTDAAKTAYRRYIGLMEAEGKAHRIPKRIKQRAGL